MQRTLLTHGTRALLLSVFVMSVQGAIAKPMSLVASAFPHRMSDRYTTAQGLPGKRVTHIAWNRGKLVVQTDTGQAVLEGGHWKPSAESFVFAPLIEKRLLPASKPTVYLTQQPFVNVDAVISCTLADALGHVWLGTNYGIYVTDGKNFWNPVDSRANIPFEAVTCLALAKDGGFWAGTTQGVCHYTAQGKWEYYWGKRWLPHNRVYGIVAGEDGSAWVATEEGVAHLYHKSVTLEEKSKHYEVITARHNRRGFVTSSSLKKPGDPNGGILFDASDNDGLWTGMYVGAEAFRYAVTKSPEARAIAKKSMWAMLDLVKYSGVSGFPARAIIQKGEEVTGYDPNETVRPDGETEKIWFTSPVDPNVICKGDTSSDEMDGHYFAWYLYYKLVADEGEKAEIEKAVRACTDNILEHDLTLVGHTGRKTRWGVWNPKYVNDDPFWWEERGLNSLEMLTFLKVAEYICKDAKYGQKYNELVTKHHYLLNTVNQKVLGEWYLVNHSDDEMAFMMYYVLMDLEREPTHRRILVQSIERSWRAERAEFSPLFNFIYGAMTGNTCDVEASVTTLQEWPWEMVDWEVRGTHRSDVSVLRTERNGRAAAQTTIALSPAERRLMRWNGNPFECDGGSPNGASEEDAGVWLLPYWMGRYHRFIRE